MKGWFRCGKCAHQWETSGSSFSNQCPECGHTGGDCVIGSKKPDWYGPKDDSLGVPVSKKPWWRIW